MKYLKSCPVCKSDEIKRKYVYENFEVFSCKSCGIMFRNPLLEVADIKNFYNENYYKELYLDERVMKGSEHVWEARLRFLKTLLGKGENLRILDIGSAFGGLLDTASKQGFKECWGVEISTQAVEWLKTHKPHINVLEGAIEEISLPKDFFDIVTMVEVIEHLVEPKEVLEKIFHSLVERGIVLIQTANFRGLQAKLWGKHYHYILPWHQFYFSDKSLENLLKSIGFREVKIIYGVEFGLLPKLKKYISNIKKVLQLLKIPKIILYHYFSKIKIFGTPLTSSMVVIARK